MKIASIAVLAASILSFAAPSLAQARTMRHHHSHRMMMGSTGGKMAAHRNF